MVRPAGHVDPRYFHPRPNLPDLPLPPVFLSCGLEGDVRSEGEGRAQVEVCSSFLELRTWRDVRSVGEGRRHMSAETEESTPEDRAQRTRRGGEGGMK